MCGFLVVSSRKLDSFSALAFQYWFSDGKALYAALISDQGIDSTTPRQNYVLAVGSWWEARRILPALTPSLSSVSWRVGVPCFCLFLLTIEMRMYPSKQMTAGIVALQ